LPADETVDVESLSLWDDSTPQASVLHGTSAHEWEIVTDGKWTLSRVMRRGEGGREIRVSGCNEFSHHSLTQRYTSLFPDLSHIKILSRNIIGIMIRSQDEKSTRKAKYKDEKNLRGSG
jgi:hypothetical protein